MVADLRRAALVGRHGRASHQHQQLPSQHDGIGRARPRRDVGEQFEVVLPATRAAAGVTGAVVFVVGGVIASRIGSGLPITVYFAGAGLGILVSAATIPALGAHWRLGWTGLGVAAGLAALLSWSAARSDEPPAATNGRVRPLWRAGSTYLLFAAGYITYITFLSAYLADRHAPTTQVVLTWTALGPAVTVAPARWSRPITNWPGTRASTVLLGLLAGGAALALLTPAPLVVLGSAVV
ncbi:hypothetical protein FHS29_004730 [Saccharothrix tamanrassetensis]|uniref:Uncharacterized protein n=1 Tax=Saccharothrix tamanrassetensis TaxID=1051531 RepID=A0A841CHW7_9PSEU|nr:YbfB/YjiJ family MFS transporter [Saccharothrix tamanrassetensis]MBB5958122.1 hypothetical protein [Saccharothrix tamanrassetensis]